MNDKIIERAKELLEQGHPHWIVVLEAKEQIEREEKAT